MAANGAETLKTTVEQFTTAGNQAFKDSIEKSLSALGEVERQLEEEPRSGRRLGHRRRPRAPKRLARRRWPIRRRRMEDHVAAAKSLTAAKSVQEVVELQTAYAKSAFEAYIAEMTKASETVSASVKE